MKWSIPLIWEEGDVWILGGGPSLPRQFGVPEEVIESVMKGLTPPSAYSPYMSAIHNYHVIGINVAYLIGDWIDMVFFGDPGFFRGQRESLAKWPGIKITCWEGAERLPWVKYLARDPKKNQGISSNPATIVWNANSGAAAISIAANAGAKRIILVGFDMKRNPTGNKHWHTLYGIPTPPRAVKVRGDVPNTPEHNFARHLRGFGQIARDAQERGIEILNACPESAIKQFPKYTIKELLIDNS